MTAHQHVECGCDANGLRVGSDDAVAVNSGGIAEFGQVGGEGGRGGEGAGAGAVSGDGGGCHG